LVIIDSLIYRARKTELPIAQNQYISLTCSLFLVLQDIVGYMSGSILPNCYFRPCPATWLHTTGQRILFVAAIANFIEKKDTISSIPTNSELQNTYGFSMISISKHSQILNRRSTFSSIALISAWILER
jgi:hypothetical protein